MQNFIVWMNPDREESAAAAAKLNGAVLTAHTDGAMAAIRRELKILGLGADLAIFAQTCEEFAKQILVVRQHQLTCIAQEVAVTFGQATAL